jgi:sugar O-acyltransferase (sialic acid O-acetyltransferase NeuD family)
MIQRCNPFFVELPPFTRLYIFGAGGAGREIAWLAQQSWGSGVEIRFLVDQEVFLSNSVNGLPVVLLSNVTAQASDRCVVGLGEGGLRRQIVEQIHLSSLAFTSLVHPRAEMSIDVRIAEGVVVCAGSIVTTNIEIARHVHINVGCTVSHDVSIGEFSTLSPGVHVSGNVQIGREVFIGTGANILNGRAGAPLVIGDGSVVAAGACVTRSVEAGTLVAGVPAVRKR